jgi:hypothetical protein
MKSRWASCSLLGTALRGTMPDDMGAFRVDIELKNPARPGEQRILRSVLVDGQARPINRLAVA